VKVFVRVGFVLLILLGLLEQIAWFRTLRTGAGPMETLVAGVARLGLQRVGQDASGLIHAAAAGCAVPVTLGLFALDGGEDASAAELLGPSVRPRFVYLGSMEEQIDRPLIWKSWLFANIEALLGLRQTRVPTKLVMVVLPKDCPHLDELNWAMLSPGN
jgi:hypothetical protein